MKHILLIVLLTLLLPTRLMACVCFGSVYRYKYDNCAEMEKYAFIAHVKILDSKIVRKAEKGNGALGQLKIEILELFKGSARTEIYETGKETSCEMGIFVGQEWVLFGYEYKGEIYIGACNHDFKYKEKDGYREWQYPNASLLIKKLQKVYDHEVPIFTNQIRKEYYSNGQLEVIEQYKNGMLEGERKIWYPNGQLMCSEFYQNGSRDGHSQWYYKTGLIKEDAFYDKGKNIDSRRCYYDTTFDRRFYDIELNTKSLDSMEVIFHRIQVSLFQVYNKQGDLILHRLYDQSGRIDFEKLYDPRRKFFTQITYHPNGKIRHIAYYQNDCIIGRAQTFDIDGNPTQSKDYDENGHEIK